MACQMWCTYCNREFSGQRCRYPAFCSAKCRQAFHRDRDRNGKLNAALTIIGRETGLDAIPDANGRPAVQRLKQLPRAGIFALMMAMGYRWNSDAYDWQCRANPEAQTS